VIHRDVKPGNLLIDEHDRVKVTDFGIARAVDSVPLTEAGRVVGTARYMSPEQATGRATSAASDIYALGLVAYEMLAGRRPFAAEHPGALAMAQAHEAPAALPTSIPGSVRAFVERALAKDPADRPSDARLFAEEARALDRALAGDDTVMVALPPTSPMTAVINPAATSVMPSGVAGGSASLAAETMSSRRRRRAPRRNSGRC